jgi:hypothetical protein
MHSGKTNRGKLSLMPRKDPEARREYHREYIRKWYARNKALQKSRVRANTVQMRNKLAEFVNEFKRGDKVDDICGMRMRTVRRESITAEIDKCEVVCATGHRARTHARRLGIEVQVSEFVKTFGGKYVSVLIYKPVAGGGIEPPTNGL